ncbi:Fic family protein [Shewanella sp. D64]|uniref:Fic family protein n=1 Tax=unclassified Shewanella TaxID=196818 RepID=UPI0022BA5E65|nr:MULTISPECIES: Fic family protein [unclassified Shewanella]MEC4727176.1 Fic family protein [Shewanella sp. D64]MEC4739207.1 Fic family protein [Shewanella sp. E94]WBJ95548.1 Fic family protein [Shewanella sp. MTB7]
MWIWQQADWPDFSWDSRKIAPLLRQVNFNQGLLTGKLNREPSTQITLDTLLANIIHSSAIEGEKLNAFSVRSSLANKLGVSDEKPFPTTAQTDGLAEMMLDALQNWQSELTLARILGWHNLLFPEGYTLFNPVQGGTLRGDAPMQVVSGRIDKPKVHFEAPPRVILDSELEQFILWFNSSRHDTDLDPLIRAAITHLWFVTLHPLDDGNGRITRLLTDLALAQAENNSIRFYAMSVSILERRQAYYEMLEISQKGELDITSWLVWFLDTLNASLQKSLDDIAQTISKTNYWQRVDQTLLSAEQIKVLNRLLDASPEHEFELGISSSQYQKVAKVSRATATRHLAQLVEQRCLVKADAGGRSTRYLLLTS